MKPILCLCIYIIAGISIYAQIATTGRESSLLSGRDCWSFSDSLFEKMSMPLYRDADKIAFNSCYNYYFKSSLSGNKALEKIFLPAKELSSSEDSLSKKLPMVFSKYSLLNSRPYDSAVVRGSKSFFYPLHHYNYKNSFSRKEKWQSITEIVGAQALSTIAANNNYVYPFNRPK